MRVSSMVLKKKIKLLEPMPTTIQCPHCHQSFPMEEAVNEEFKKDLRDKMLAFKKEKEKELQTLLQQKEADYAQQLANEKKTLQENLTADLRKNIGTEYENKLQLLQQNNADQQEKLKLAREKEMYFLQQEQQLKTKAEEMELHLQRTLQTERTKINEEARKREEQKAAMRDSEYQLKLKELEKQLDDQKKLAEEMKRKAEQGSMQLQGEVQELLLEELLKTAFPFDVVTEVGKGVKGADCILTIRNPFGQTCGSIIFESKRTKTFDQNWLEKLKADMRSQSADIAILVTEAMPHQTQHYTEKEGIWICPFSQADIKALVSILRDALIRIYTATQHQHNKGDKMSYLYDYLISTEFSEQWKAIREGFVSMKTSIQKERDAMERMWKMREKQLEKVLLNAAHIRGSIDGIAGLNAIDFNLLEDESETLNP
jgi:hypothetical protein